MPKKVTKMTMEAVAKEFVKARDAWLAEHVSPEKIENTVHSAMDSLLREHIGLHLGFEYSWGSVRIDHCNGRSSKFQRDIDRLIEEKLPDLVEKHAFRFMVDLTAKELAALKKEYKTSLDVALRQYVREQAHSDAKELCLKYTQQLSKEASAHLASVVSDSEEDVAGSPDDSEE